MFVSRKYHYAMLVFTLSPDSETAAERKTRREAIENYFFGQPEWRARDPDAMGIYFFWMFADTDKSLWDGIMNTMVTHHTSLRWQVRNEMGPKIQDALLNYS